MWETKPSDIKLLAQDNKASEWKSWDWNLSNLTPDCTLNHGAILPPILSLKYSQKGENIGRIYAFQLKSGFLQKSEIMSGFFPSISYVFSLFLILFRTRYINFTMVNINFS